MPKFAPQQDVFKTVLQLDKISNWIIWIVFVLSISVAILPSIELEKEIDSYVIRVIEVTNIFLLIIGFTLTTIKDFYLFPKAETQRRRDYIDNSLGVNFSLKNSEQYYTNDEVKPGVYKMGVNLFQNVFFTTTISRKMQTAYITKSVIFIVVFVVLAVYGFKNSPLALPILQMLFSAFVLGDLIKLFLFMNKNSKILESLTAFFSSKNTDETIILKNYIEYETNLAWAMILINDAIFNKYNESIEKDWQKIKTKYKLNG